MTATLDRSTLLTFTDAQLDELFGTLESGPIPDGPANGTAIIAAGTRFADEIAQAINVFAWQGKTFDAKSGTLRNRILPFGLNAIIARVYKGPSLFDQRECIVLDYSETSLVAHWLRDEIRLIAPKLYLGRVYLDQKPSIHFSLQFE